MQIEHHFVNFFRHQTDPVCVHCTVYTVQVCIRVCVCVFCMEAYSVHKAAPMAAIRFEFHCCSFFNIHFETCCFY